MSESKILSHINSKSWDWEGKSLEELNDIPHLRSKVFEEFKERVRRFGESKENFTIEIDDDEFLMIFLRTQKFNVENALLRLDRFYQIRLCRPDLVVPIGKGPKDFSHVFDNGLVTMLNERNPIDGSLIILWSFRNFDPKDGPLADMLNVSIYAVMEALRDPSIQTYGIRYVFDLSDLKFSHVRAMLTSFYYLKAIIRSQNGVPARFKGMHYINDPLSLTSVVYRVIRPALSRKMQERFHFHGKNLQELFTYVSEEILPKEFGGKAADNHLRSGPDQAHWFREALFEEHENIVRKSHFGYK